MDDALLAEVIAHPEDDGVRAVLADVLQAAGDPRGELISLQLLASRADHRADRVRDHRIHELLAANGKTWLSRLSHAARSCRFDRGFPSRLALGGEWSNDDVRWEDAAKDPVFATVEDLLPGTVRGAVYRRFLTGARTNVRRIEVYDRDSLEGLRDSSAPVEHVACVNFVADDEYRRQDHQLQRQRLALRGRTIPDFVPRLDREDTPELHFHRLWDVLARKPGVTSLGITDAQLQTVLDQRWFPRIRALVIGGSNLRQRLAQWHDLGQRHLVLVPYGTLEPCEARFPWDFKVEVIPQARGAIARISGEWMIMPTAVLEALPPEVTRVEIEHSSPVITQRIRDHVVRPGVEVVEVPLRANNFVWEIR